MSRFVIGGCETRVLTCVHPSLDAVALRIESSAIGRGGLEVTLDFPYPSLRNEAWVGDFNHPEAHQTTVTRPGGNRANFERRVDDARYHVALAWSATWRMKLKVPALVGVPPTRPVLPRLKPSGSAPQTRLQV